MSDEARRHAEEIVARWRSGADPDSPAGPMYASGQYAESEIVLATWGGSGKCGTACTASTTRYCC